MNVSLLNVLTICGLVLFAANAADARRIKVTRTKTGVVAVTDLEEGTIYYPKDPEKFIKDKYLTPRKVEVLGRRSIMASFQRGSRLPRLQRKSLATQSRSRRN